ncbi:hypothetical protein ASZ78_001210 [Callipepla squamata]|uniref:Mitochondria-eating protein C-terminal domain-containing protein n=1 Tax=Callipepla squamata TaxID=9009 RepID=A0A226MYM2_CALSU|nr:hypothetical protein ASZ78_001210 [Callipepla squamata]
MDGLLYKIYSQNEMPEREHMDADPREVTSEDIRRETLYTAQQTSAYGSNTSEQKTSNLNVSEGQELKALYLSVPEGQELKALCLNVSERQEQLEKEFSARPGVVSQNELQDQECEKLRKKNREIEARYQKLLSKTMSMHKQSENMNDPMRLSAVLDMYRMLRIQEWGKCWSRSAHFSYQKARIIIKNLFDACERDIEMRKAAIIEILCILPPNRCNQELMLDTVKLLRHGYYHNDSSIYSEIIRDSPVKAVWNQDECSLQWLEHVDYKELKYSKISELQMLWPVLKDGEEVIEKGVVWNEN